MQAKREEKMDDDTTRLCRALLQLSQATEAIITKETPANEGVPEDGAAILRLLRWHGPKTIDAIANFVRLPIERTTETIGLMVESGFIRNASATDTAVVELAAEGVAVARRIAVAQRNRVQQAAERLSSQQRETAANLLEELVGGLVGESESFKILCSECWAFDARECIKGSPADDCALVCSDSANLDPNLQEGPEDCPVRGPALACRTAEFGKTIGVSGSSGPASNNM